MKPVIDAYGVAVRTGAISPQAEDEDSFRSKLGLPPMSAAAKNAWDADHGVRRPITIAPTPTNQTASPTPASTPASEDTDEPAEENQEE